MLGDSDFSPNLEEFKSLAIIMERNLRKINEADSPGEMQIFQDRARRVIVRMKAQLDQIDAKVG